MMLLPPPQETQVSPMPNTTDRSRTRGALGFKLPIISNRDSRQRGAIQRDGPFHGPSLDQEETALHTTGAVVLTETVMDVLLELEISIEAGHDVNVASDG
jgi:hypothetical protein